MNAAVELAWDSRQMEEDEALAMSHSDEEVARRLDEDEEGRKRQEMVSDEAPV